MLTINFAWIGPIILIVILLFLVHNLRGLKLFSNHDNSMFEKFLDKYPDVAPAFMTKGIKEQNIENNQEIHEILVRLAKIEKRLSNG